ncbi:hypothetical protein E4U33_006324, partial [Claviceps sp. LM78 group G4]
SCRSTPATSGTSSSKEGRGTREPSALGGTGSKSTGLAASKKLDPYGDSQDAENPKYDPRRAKRATWPKSLRAKGRISRGGWWSSSTTSTLTDILSATRAPA